MLKKQFDMGSTPLSPGIQANFKASPTWTPRPWTTTSASPTAITHSKNPASFIPGNPNLITTGCYDGVVRIFDTRLLLLVAKFNHDNPLEDILALSPTTLVSAGGPQVKVWDLSRGLKIHEFNNFTKTATTLHNTGDRGLLVGSLDGHVKIFDYTTPNWDVKFGWKFGSGGVLCSAVSPNFKHFATGLTSGLLSIRTRKNGTQER